MPKSKGEELLNLQLRAVKVPEWEREYRFAHPRRWRFDFAWPDQKLAVEVEGLTPEGGRHQRIGGFQKDLEKYEAAVMRGWIVYRCSHKMIKSGEVVNNIEVLLRDLPKLRTKRAINDSADQ